MKLILRILGNCLAIYIATRIVPGFEFIGSNTALLIAGATIGLVNALVKPIVKFITFPLIILTLGLFNLVISIALLILASKLLPGLVIHGFWPALWGVLILSVVNHLIDMVGKGIKDNK